MDTNKINQQTRERISCLLKESGISVNKLEKLTGISQRTLQNQINEEVKISMVTIRAIIEVFKEINPLWILFGDPHQKHLVKDAHLPEIKKKKIRYFRILTEEHTKEEDVLLSIRNIAGLNQNEKVIITHTNFYAPMLPAGCYVFLSLLSNWKKFIEYGRIYYLELKDKRHLFTYIQKGEKAITFTLHPLNQQEPPTQIPLSLIKKVWLVQQKIEEM